jgi:peptide/nickel transport system ATP-binding protein
MERDMQANSTETAAPLCEIDGLKIGFRGHDGVVSDAVRDLSLTLAPGERLGIVGESGPANR